MSDKLEETTCPECASGPLEIVVHLRAQEIGSFSLAGQQMKFSAESFPVLTCPAGCGWQQMGWFETGYAVFPRRP